jgi:hypothetical protein
MPGNWHTQLGRWCPLARSFKAGARHLWMGTDNVWDQHILSDLLVEFTATTAQYMDG